MLFFSLNKFAYIKNNIYLCVANKNKKDMNERDQIILERGIIYDQISKALTQYEDAANNTCSLDNCRLEVENLYAVLVLVQRHWEDIITANCD